MKRFLTDFAAAALLMAWVAVPFSEAKTPAATETKPPASPAEQSEEANPKPAPTEAAPPAQSAKLVAKRPPYREMTDSEMDGVSGGITGSFDWTGNGNLTMTDNSVQSISLTDQAQQNLSSLVNILSINSSIQVMMNLNVTINSTVGTVNQGNTGTQTGPP